MHSRFVYFDLGNVLVTFDHEIAVRQLGKLTDRLDSEVRRAVFESDLQQRFETGLIDSKEFTAEVNRLLKTNVAVNAVMLAISDIFQPNEAILEALTYLRKRGVAMGILSNTCEAHWSWIQRQNWPMVDGWFSKSILSYEVGSMKPDQGIYQACEAACKCTGDQIFFTDDKPENIRAAQSHGWTTYQFGNVQELISCLDTWLDKN